MGRKNQTNLDKMSSKRNGELTLSFTKISIDHFFFFLVGPTSEEARVLPEPGPDLGALRGQPGELHDQGGQDEGDRHRVPGDHLVAVPLGAAVAAPGLPKKKKKKKRSVYIECKTGAFSSLLPDGTF